MKSTQRLAVLHAAFLLATARVFAGQPAAPVKPVSEKSVEAAVVKPTTRPASVATETAKSDFPYTLQGVFGLPGRADASLRAVGSEKSVWVKPGEKIGGWTLVGVDPVKAVAVLSKDGRNVTLRRSGSIPGGSESGSDAEGDFNGKPLVLKKLDELQRRKDLKVYEFFVDAESKLFGTLLKTHPQFMLQEGASTKFLMGKPGADRAYYTTLYNGMLESKSPEADMVRPMIEALRDAAVRVLPKEDNSPQITEEQSMGNVIDMWREADRIYKTRHPRK